VYEHATCLHIEPHWCVDVQVYNPLEMETDKNTWESGDDKGQILKFLRLLGHRGVMPLGCLNANQRLCGDAAWHHR
jgi:hypothetical protein